MIKHNRYIKNYSNYIERLVPKSMKNLRLEPNF